MVIGARNLRLGQQFNAQHSYDVVYTDKTMMEMYQNKSLYLSDSTKAQNQIL